MSKYDTFVRTKEINNKFIQNTSEFWNTSKCNSVEVLGSLMEHINECFKEKEIYNFEEWETYFYSKVTKEQLNKCYFQFKNELDKNNIKYTKEELKNTILIHCILQTYEGYTRENIAKNFLRKNKDIVKIEKTSKEIDANYFIDYILTLKNNKRVGVQVKSLSYVFMVMKQDKEKNSYKKLVEKMNSYKGCDYTFVLFVDVDRVAKVSEQHFNSKIGWWLR